ncbi:MAG: nitronate monooxygenase, partial [Henriciella sp.]|nr:nitronate monooxygenase [Henriciella sp.]
APIHDGIKDKIVSMDENQTQVIFRTFNNTVRVYRNSVSEKVAAVEAAGGTYNDIRELVSGANQEVAWQTGDIEAGMVSAGLSGALVEQVLTCEELIDSIVAEAKSIITHRLMGMLADA